MRILFVCHGNICRSPMAEFITKQLLDRRGEGFTIASAATSGEELGNPVYPPARKKLLEHGIDCSGKTARRLTGQDYEKWDLIIGMDSANMRNMLKLFGGDPKNKLHRLLDYTPKPRDVADPWYTGDFEQCFSDISQGCRGLIASIDADTN